MHPIKGVSPSLYRQYIEGAVRGWSGQFTPEDERFGLGDELISVRRIRRLRTAEAIKAVAEAKTVKRSVNARKPAPKKVAPRLFTVRINSKEPLASKASRLRDVAGRLSLDGAPPVRAVRAKALDNAKGTAFTLKVPIESNKVKARSVAQEVQMAVADSFGEYATVKRQYEGR
jgi:hypothetical protein